MPILLEAESRSCTTVYRGTAESASRKRLLTEADGTQLLHQNIGDCIGDVLMGAMLDEKLAKFEISDKKIIISGFANFSPQYYSVDSLVLYYMELRKKGWKIYMEEQNVFYLECPSFEDYPKVALVPQGSRSLVVKNRSYAHPIDAGIIKTLDMPGVKTVAGMAVDQLINIDLGPVIASGIRVTDKNFPEVNEIVEHCVATLGIKRPYVVVSNYFSMNACATGSDEDPIIILGNTLVRVMDKQKLTFIIGHECGHIAMGHMIYHSLVAFATQFADKIPVIGRTAYQAAGYALNAWSRRSEITADRAGLLCCQNVESAKRALLQLETGFINAERLDMTDYLENGKQFRRKNVLRRVGEFTAAHPPLPKRIEALDLFANSELYYDAQCLPAPPKAIGEHQLTQSVEKIIAVLGKE